MRTAHLKIAKWFLVLAAFVAILALAGPSQRSQPVQAAGEIIFPELTVSPTSGPPGTPVELWGTGFPPLQTFTVTFSQFPLDIPLGFTASDESGTVWVNTAVPDEAQPGSAEFIVGNTLVSASAPFEVAGGEIGDDEPPKVENCLVTITLAVAQVVDSRFSEGQLLTFNAKTSPSTRGAPGANVAVAAENSGDLQGVNLVVAEYLRAKHAFPYPLTVSALVDFGGVRATDRESTTVTCPGLHSVVLSTEHKHRFFGLVVDKGFVVLGYDIEVTEVDAQ